MGIFMNWDWTKISVIFTIATTIVTALTAFATFVAAGVALYIANTEQKRKDKHRNKLFKSQKCDLILIPTKEWDSGAYYMLFMQELEDVGIKKEWFENSQIFLLDPLELNWLDTERIYGVNIKKDKFVMAARHRLMTTQYFKNAIITTQGEKHDDKLFQATPRKEIKK